MIKKKVDCADLVLHYCSLYKKGFQCAEPRLKHLAEELSNKDIVLEGLKLQPIADQVYMQYRYCYVYS